MGKGGCGWEGERKRINRCEVAPSVPPQMNLGAPATLRLFLPPWPSCACDPKNRASLQWPPRETSTRFPGLALPLPRMGQQRRGESQDLCQVSLQTGFTW